MEFYKILEDIMSEKDMSIPDVSRATGISDSTLRSIINRKTKSASLEVAFKISKGLNVSLERLNGDAKVESKKLNFFLESFEIDHIKKYRDLDEYGRKTIDLILERELDRYKQFQQLQNKTANLTVIEGDDEPAEDYGENVVMMPTLMQKLCAGTGSVGDDVQLENEPYPAIRVPVGAKYAATVAGDSMEPEYSDGDVVFFNDTNTPRFGDIVVLSINKENYLKKYTERGFEALNPKYDILVPGESDFVIVFGKVLGKL